MKRYTGLLMQSAPLAHVRDLCLALPETTETGRGEDPTFSVRGQTFATGRRVGDRQSVWFKANLDTHRELVTTQPQQFFAPPYVGRHGWLAAWLNEDCDWVQLSELLKDSYRMTAPKPLIDMLADSVTSALPSRDPVGRPA
ncbi:MmcQ/YjbR family DNA-binding protein [Stackebrandtia endophytica]